ESVVLEIAGRRIGIAGVKGFGGGFAGACGSEFGELEMKAFIRHTKDTARQLLHALKSMQCDVRVALTHYAPTKDTLLGEKLEIYPFLGSHLLGEAIDEADCDLALHGHAHHGAERGITPGGVPVRNVAKPLIRSAYQLYSVRTRAAAKSARASVSEDAPAPTTAWSGRARRWTVVAPSCLREARREHVPVGSCGAVPGGTRPRNDTMARRPPSAARHRDSPERFREGRYRHTRRARRRAAVPTKVQTRDDTAADFGGTLMPVERPSES